MAEKTKKEEVKEEPKKKEGEKTVKEVWDGITKKLDEDEMNVVYAMIGAASEGGAEETNKESDGGKETMKHNVFENDNTATETVLAHSDKNAIVELAKRPGISSLKSSMSLYAQENETLAHAFDQGDAETVKLLFPEPHLINPGAPEIIRDFDNSWVSKVISKIHKRPFTKIRTRKADARGRRCSRAPFRHG